MTGAVGQAAVAAMPDGDDKKALATAVERQEVYAHDHFIDSLATTGIDSLVALQAPSRPSWRPLPQRTNGARLTRTHLAT